MRSGSIYNVIKKYKYSPTPNPWGYIFARLVVGHLNARAALFRPFDLIVPSPTFIGQESGARTWDHTAFVLGAALELAAQWPILLRDPQLVTKSGATPSMTGLSYRQRKLNAEGAIRDSLRVNGEVEGKRVLVFDDIFTDGLTLREVARALRSNGAETVCGVTLARGAYQGR
jgi:predicted amidophosphoribosyltransferase